MIAFSRPGALAALLSILTGLALAACAPLPETAAVVPADGAAPASARPGEEPVDPALYASRSDGTWTLPAIDVAAFPPGLLRHSVPYAGDEAPGSIVIDTKGPFLYFIEPEGRAIRYGIAIGREGFGWTGEGVIARTAHWPRWTPPPEMIERDPSLGRWAGGMPGGPRNPLGARALYIYFDGVDSGFRVHGTNEPKSIGWAASSGCFRMLNQDVIDLYQRVAIGAPVKVI
ncbi:MAG: L,D-transpeptidase [Rhodovulum sulfidophilum]|uniref:L,D-transpeptidase n=1 Tax=Rhodovulum sulfidophilum TaxID=35806 RepID=A0A2W5NHV9_RHOSU|nr:MAG: L,D-transpeptidase [Rhodovulum sulfidophilum]